MQDKLLFNIYTAWVTSSAIVEFENFNLYK